ncbi:heavy metal-binding domain-containing protein [Weissella coleopterorum]|uniref:UPF0145 protein G7084_05380 n=1 Tax=Weissella coleopterorum TaxID=2714949 RepID=A0A6G8B0P7_9LACO|nr:heavy metal-binding domain-containing protein [Weissella coleopterorum]QIL50792.1 heavy metal-binding domain-containing protein [Weissella coleopterorum]
MNNIIVVTSEKIANYEITANLGEVFGLTTRSRNVFSSLGQALKAVVGGEIKGYTKLQDTAREEAIQRMRKHALELGADADIMFRFDSSSASMGDSVTAYGTAVKIKNLTSTNN